MIRPAVRAAVRPLVKLPQSGAYISAQKVSNGTFNTDLAGWVASTGGWTWDSGKALLTGDGSVQSLRQDDVMVVGKKYLISFEVDADGAIGMQNAAAAIVRSAVSGRVSFTWIADTTYVLFKRVSGTVTGTLDNISVHEVIE